MNAPRSKVAEPERTDRYRQPRWRRCRHGGARLCDDSHHRSVGHQPISARLEFKGGTSLRLCHFAGYRYSADLDMNLTGGLSRDEALQGIEQALPEVRDLLQLPQLALSTSGASIDFIGARRQRRPQRIKLDLSEDELTGGGVTRLSVLQRYRDQQPSDGIPTYSLLETPLGNFAASFSDFKPATDSTLHHLVCEAAVDPLDAWERFEAKAAHKNIDPNLFWERLDHRMEQYRARWDNEMPTYVQSYLGFDQLERQLRRALRALRP